MTGKSLSEIKDIEMIETGLEVGYSLLEPGSFLHIDEYLAMVGNPPPTISAIVLDKNSIKEGQKDIPFDPKTLISVATADGVMYFKEPGEYLKLALTRGEHHPVLPHVAEASTRFPNNLPWHVSKEECQHILAAPGTEVFSLEEIRFNKFPDCVQIQRMKEYMESRQDSPEKMYEWEMVNQFHSLIWTIRTCPNVYGEFNNFNGEERRLAERIFGQGDHLTETMELLKDQGIREVDVVINNPYKKMKWYQKKDGRDQLYQYNDELRATYSYADVARMYCYYYYSNNSFSSSHRYQVSLEANGDFPCRDGNNLYQLRLSLLGQSPYEKKPFLFPGRLSPSFQEQQKIGVLRGLYQRLLQEEGIATKALDKDVVQGLQQIIERWNAHQRERGLKQP